MLGYIKILLYTPETTFLYTYCASSVFLTKVAFLRKFVWETIPAVRIFISLITFFIEHCSIFGTFIEMKIFRFPLFFLKTNGCKKGCQFFSNFKALHQFSKQLFFLFFKNICKFETQKCYLLHGFENPLFFI